MAGDDQQAAGAEAAGPEKPAAQTPRRAFPPVEVLREALGRGAAAAGAEAGAEPIAQVLGRAQGELTQGALSEATRRLLQTALSAAHHNGQLSASTRTALSAVAVALRGLG